jgi:hypothetical protein
MMSSTYPQLPRVHVSRPFPFLNLPAELRNRVYDAIIKDLPPFAKLTHDPSNVGCQTGFLGLVTANKQLRAEFHAMLMAKIKMEVALRDHIEFFNTFFPTKTKLLQLPRPLHVWVTVDRESRDAGVWDMRPFLIAKATTLYLHLDVRPSYMSNPGFMSLPCLGPKDRAGQLAWNLDSALERTPRSVFRDFEAGYIADFEVHMPQPNDLRGRWHLTIKKLCGGLTECEVDRFQTYSTALVDRERRGWPAFTSSKLMLHVVDFEGKLVEEWFTGKNGVLKQGDEEEDEDEGENSEEAEEEEDDDDNDDEGEEDDDDDDVDDDNEESYIW